MPHRESNNDQHLHTVTGFIFYGNIFYGVCAVALAIEAALQQGVGLNRWPFYVLLFVGTVFYYTHAYTVNVSGKATNPVSRWYARHILIMRQAQRVFALIGILTLFWYGYDNYFGFVITPWWEWLLIILFPLVALSYYGKANGTSKRVTLRSFGWLKPFAIGFAWAGPVTLYPILFHGIENETVALLSATSAWLFLKNFMFISVLCILFDIKDYAHDRRTMLKTFVVETGLRVTLFYIVLPLCLLGLISFVYYAVAHHFHPMKILLNVLPFVALGAVTYELRKRKSILYYRTVVDGLMLLKATCGIVAMIYF